MRGDKKAIENVKTMYNGNKNILIINKENLKECYKNRSHTRLYFESTVVQLSLITYQMKPKKREKYDEKSETRILERNYLNKCSLMVALLSSFSQFTNAPIQ